MLATNHPAPCIRMTTDARDPSNYLPHPLGYACADCNASSEIGVACLHTSRCDVAPRTFLLPFDQKPGTDLRPASRKANAAFAAWVKAQDKARAAVSLRAAAAEGLAPLHFSDEEIAMGVRNGEISESDAMNQDC